MRSLLWARAFFAAGVFVGGLTLTPDVGMASPGVPSLTSTADILHPVRRGDPCQFRCWRRCEPLMHGPGGFPRYRACMHRCLWYCHHPR